MQHVGILSLSVGDIVILEQEEEETDLSSALIQAITAECTEAVSFYYFLVQILTAPQKLEPHLLPARTIL